MNRGFEIISKHKGNLDYKLPKRMTKHSIGYDFFSPVDIIIPAKGEAKIYSGIKSFFLEDEGLFMNIRSSWGIKYSIRIKNSVGVIDSDYYNNENNEGEIIVGLKNESDKDFEIKKGDRYCQGIFHKCLLADNDNFEDKSRNHGIGYTSD